MTEILLNGNFYNPTKGSVTISQVLEELVGYMQEKPAKTYEMVVGCDSSAVLEPTFPLVIVMLRKGEGGRFFLQRVRYPERKFYNRHERILQEVLLSCDLALWLRDSFAEYVQKQAEELMYEFRYIHADVGENGITRDMIKEVTGLIRGNGFEPKIKPEAFVASSVADKFS